MNCNVNGSVIDAILFYTPKTFLFSIITLKVS